MNTPQTSTIAQRLKLAREHAKLTQAALADKAGISQGQVGNIESGLRNTGASVVALARALGVSVDWLSDGIGEMIQPTASIAEPTPRPYVMSVNRAPWGDAESTAASLGRALNDVLDALQRCTLSSRRIAAAAITQIAEDPAVRQDVQPHIEHVLHSATAGPPSKKAEAA